MLGKIFLVLYVIVQIAVSVLTEFIIERNRFYKGFVIKTRVIRIIIYGLLALIPFLGAYLPASDFKYRCMGFGNLWLGFFMFYSAAVIIITLIFFAYSRFSDDKEWKALGQAFNVAFVLAVIITGYGLIHAQNPRIVNYEINIDKETDQVKDLKVALIADLHLSANSNVKLTRKMVEKVNSVNPDLIVIAGDIFTSNYGGLRNPGQYSKALSRMKAKYGVYAVCGNHDVEENLFIGFAISPISEAFRSKEMEQFFEDSGFRVLYDENIEIADGEVILSGRVDGEKAGDGTSNRMDARTLLSTVDKRKPVLVLQHEPIDFKALSENGADAAFCGHTHNGQIFPGNLIVPFFNENAYGLKELYGMDTIVTAGVGYYGPPIRVGTDSEVTVIDITFGKGN